MKKLITRLIIKRINWHNLRNIKPISQAQWAKNVYWMVCLEIIGYDEIQRDEFIQSLRAKNIDSRPYFYPMSDMSMYEKVDTPIAHKVCQGGLNLPSYFDITKKQVEYISNTVKELI